ncbi:MAG TPA: hypothetical protein VME17_25915 [Bryobacteraceae bacterium]|nr:hypothetical protein [Bryobacteraceae bacterium]
MKKLMTLALGLSFLTGTVSLFAAPQDKPADSSSKKKMKKKKAKKAKSDTTKS